RAPIAWVRMPQLPGSMKLSKQVSPFPARYNLQHYLSQLSLNRMLRPVIWRRHKLLILAAHAMLMIARRVSFIVSGCGAKYFMMPRLMSSKLVSVPKRYLGEKLVKSYTKPCGIGVFQAKRIIL